jgi:hypothetical protein
VNIKSGDLSNISLVLSVSAPVLRTASEQRLSSLLQRRYGFVEFTICLFMIFIIIIGFAMVQSAAHNLDVYQSRNPKASAYYKCVENHFEELERE